MSANGMGFCQVHLDFHTSPLIGDVGRDFDPERFAATVQAAHVDSVTCFAKCHHGHLYYRTDHPARHPSLPAGLDLLGAQIEALHKRGIRAPIYLSVQCDEFAANTHPEWVARNPDGTSAGRGPLDAEGWQILDIASPYLDYLVAQLEEVLERFAPADGIFFDMCWDQPSLSKWAKAAMAAWKLDPEKEEDRREYARRLSHAYMRRLHSICRRHDRKCGVYFNSRPLAALPEDLRHMTHVEIEALPTGGWGYMYFPANVRYVRTFGVPYLGMTARFHKGWADFGGLKSEAALRYETCQMLAHGARCSIGDQMHPRGVLDAAAWRLIGRVYDHVEACRPWCEQAVSAADTALLRLPAAARRLRPGGTEEGCHRMLMQLKVQYDVLDAERDFRSYRLVILPDDMPVDAVLAKRLDSFVAAGGAVLASGGAALDPEGHPTWRGLPVAGPAVPSPCTVTYFRPARAIRDLVPSADHVVYERGRRLRAVPGARSLARVVEPYFDRSWRHFCSHRQTPPARPTRHPAALVKGRVACLAYPLFGLYGRHGLPACRGLVQACLREAAGRPMVETSAPAGAEISVMRRGKEMIAHVLYWPVERRTPDLDLVEDTVPLSDVRLSLALPRRPRRAYLAPGRRPLETSWREGRAEVIIPRVEGHAMAVFELDGSAGGNGGGGGSRTPVRNGAPQASTRVSRP